MFLTEAEILDTPLSLNYTCQYFEKNKKNLACRKREYM